MAIRPASKRLLTLEEFLALPETEPASELIDGEVVQKPVARIEHSRPQRNAMALLMTDPATAAGEVFPELGLNVRRTLRGNHRVPDLSYYRPGRLLPDEGHLEAPPDLAIEIRSKGQSRRFLQEKLAFLREQGSRCTMLVDPSDRTVEVHDGDRSFTAIPGESVTLEQLNGFSFEVDALFA